MTNYEKYKKETNIIFDMNSIVAVDRGTNRLSTCRNLKCEDCLFFYKYNDDTPCTLSSVRWLFAEYTEPEIDWSKVPVDTPVLVSHNKKLWYNRYFAGINSNGDPVVYSDGRTSWSNETFGREFEHFNYIELAEVE